MGTYVTVDGIEIPVVEFGDLDLTLESAASMLDLVLSDDYPDIDAFLGGLVLQCCKVCGVDQVPAWALTFARRVFDEAGETPSYLSPDDELVSGKG